MSEEKRECAAGETGDGIRYISYVEDWILSDVFNDPFYDFKWWSDAGKSKMKPLVKRSSLAKELTLKAAEVAIASYYFGSEPIEQKKRIKFIIGKSIDDNIDDNYEKEPLSLDDVRADEKAYIRMYDQAYKRLFKLMEGLEELDDGSDSDYKERTVVRNQAFEAAYLCLRTENPEGTFYILWGAIDMFYEAMKRTAGE